jgi:hypothetical protein
MADRKSLEIIRHIMGGVTGVVIGIGIFVSTSIDGVRYERTAHLQEKLDADAVQFNS